MTAHQAKQLAELLLTHSDALQKLLPDYLDPGQPFKTEQFGPLTKYTLGQMPNETWAMLHCLTAPDVGPAGPHDHPTRFDSYGIKNSYWERIFHEDGRVELVLRAAGGNHTIWPHTVHSIIALPEGPAWTLVFGHQIEREARHYPELAAAA